MMPEAVTAFEQVVVTTPDGQQVLATRWATTPGGTWEVSWRPVAHTSETWRLVDRDDWRLEVQT